MHTELFRPPHPHPAHHWAGVCVDRSSWAKGRQEYLGTPPGHPNMCLEHQSVDSGLSSWDPLDFEEIGFIFQSTFRLTVKLRRRYRDFPLAPTHARRSPLPASPQRVRVSQRTRHHHPGAPLALGSLRAVHSAVCAVVPRPVFPGMITESHCPQIPCAPPAP